MNPYSFETEVTLVLEPSSNDNDNRKKKDDGTKTEPIFYVVSGVEEDITMPVQTLLGSRLVKCFKMTLLRPTMMPLLLLVGLHNYWVLPESLFGDSMHHR